MTAEIVQEFFTGLGIALFAAWIGPIILNWLLCMIMIWCFKQKPMYLYNVHELAHRMYDWYLGPIMSWVGLVFTCMGFCVIVGDKMQGGKIHRCMKTIGNVLWNIPIGWLVSKFKRIRIK